MAKKNSDKPKTTKPKNPDAKKRNQKSWRAKQLTRVESLERFASKLEVSLAANAPGVNQAIVTNVRGLITAVKTQLEQLAADWKPSKASHPKLSKKVGIGDTIRLSDEVQFTEEWKKKYPSLKWVTRDTYANAVVVDEETKKYWMVRCADGTVRMLNRKWAVKVPPLPPLPQKVEPLEAFIEGRAFPPNTVAAS